jgi:hypothetical protein
MLSAICSQAELDLPSIFGLNWNFVLIHFSFLGWAMSVPYKPGTPTYKN